MCPKDKLFRGMEQMVSPLYACMCNARAGAGAGYIELELKLREFDRCRVLYEKFLEYNPANCSTWYAHNVGLA